MLAAAQQKLIIWTFVLVIGLGLLSVFLLLQAPTSLPDKSRGATQLYRNQNSPSRDPASIADGKKTVDARLPRKDTPHANNEVFLPCQRPENNPITVFDKQIKITGAICHPGPDFPSLEIRNKTNGVTATVFIQDGKSFTTDYISLNSGENKIHISHLFKQGTREEHEITLLRQNSPRTLEGTQK